MSHGGCASRMQARSADRPVSAPLPSPRTEDRENRGKEETAERNEKKRGTGKSANVAGRTHILYKTLH